jgi:hypothetical protein
LREIEKKEQAKPRSKYSNNINDDESSSLKSLDSLKFILVYFKKRIEILKRWWYCFDQWPPENFDCDEELSKYKLRIVEASFFRQEPEFDKKGE